MHTECLTHFHVSSRLRPNSFCLSPFCHLCRTEENGCAVRIQNALHFVIINVKRLFISAAICMSVCVRVIMIQYSSLLFSPPPPPRASMSHFVTYIFGMNSYDEYCVLFLTSKWIVFDLCTWKMSFHSIKTKTEGRNELRKWKKFCEWCNTKRRHTRAHPHTKHFIYFHWIGFMMRKSCDAEWKQNNMRRMSTHTETRRRGTVMFCQSKLEAKWCEGNVCVCERCDACLFTVASDVDVSRCAIVAIEIGNVRTLHFILFMIRRRVWVNVFAKKYSSPGSNEFQPNGLMSHDICV